MGKLAGKIAWITGAGSGIGEAAAVALAAEGARVVLTGRRPEALRRVAERIGASGGEAAVEPGDVARAETAERVVVGIVRSFGGLHILVNNAGLNVVEREWARLRPAGVDEVIHADLSSAFYCVIAALAPMRAQKDGVLIHTASLAGRLVSPLGGPTYSAAKHGVVAMSHSINMEECVNGIRSCALCPGEVATPILDRRPVPVNAEERGRMVQPEDCGDLIRYIACLPPHVCINEIWISPTWNRGYVAALQRKGP